MFMLYRAVLIVTCNRDVAFTLNWKVPTVYVQKFLGGLSLFHLCAYRHYMLPLKNLLQYNCDTVCIPQKYMLRIFN